MAAFERVKDALKQQSDTLKHHLNTLDVKTHFNAFHL